jgi:hypothetical protein
MKKIGIVLILFAFVLVAWGFIFAERSPQADGKFAVVITIKEKVLGLKGREVIVVEPGSYIVIPLNTLLLIGVTLAAVGMGLKLLGPKEKKKKL